MNPVRAVIGTLLTTALDAALLAIALGGIAPLLSHRRALALLAIWATGSLVLGIARPVKRHDPVEETKPQVGMMLALLLIPMAVPPLAAWTEAHGLWTLDGEALGWTGVVIAGLGLALRAAAMLRLGSRFSPIAAVQRGHTVESRWPYSWLRHPGYAGTLLAALGAALAFRSALALPAVLGLALLYRGRIGEEEAALERHLGDEWKRYRERTAAFIPKVG
jgi:protein-S-isoprenylcysteine O-methyltransferase Ste14